MENTDPLPRPNRKAFRNRLASIASRLLRIGLLCLMLLAATPSLTAQATIRIVTDTDTEQPFFLAHYYGSKLLSVDTSFVRNKDIVFSNTSSYPEGCYVLADSQKTPVLNFILGQDQNITIHGSAISKQITSIEGGRETGLFLSYTIKKQRALEALHPFEAADPAISAYVEQSQKDFKDLCDTIMKTDSASFVALLVKALQEPRIPDSIAHLEAEAYRYYKEHYWDGFDLSDKRLLNTPLIESRLDTYLDQVVAPLPDSLCDAIDKLFARCPSSAIRGFIFWHLIAKYQYPVYMGQDQVFVHLYDRYFDTLNGTSLSEANHTWLCQKAERLRRLALGQKAPDLCFKDENGHHIDMENIESEYLVLFFQDHDCEVCHSELQQLRPIVSDSLIQFTVLCIDLNANGVSNKPDAPSGSRFIYVNGVNYKGENPQQLYDIDTTPLLYLLDRDKCIIAKQIHAHQILEVISKHIPEQTSSN